jgi:anti-anti-sigma factor
VTRPKRAEAVVVALPAEIDLANAGAIGLELAAAFAPGVSTVVADLTATTFCDLSGARMLLLACMQAADNGAELRLAAAGPAVRHTLELRGLDRLVRIYPSLDKALQ